jgi:DNA (cytosine-5)-methyltransferase 1
MLNHVFQRGARSYLGHTGSLRYFTVRESARLQNFPDEFKFHGSWSEAMRQVGNAVPVDLATIVGASVKNALARANSCAVKSAL